MASDIDTTPARPPRTPSEERVIAILRRLGPAAAAVALVGYTLTVLVMHLGFRMPFTPLGWTNVYGLVVAAVALVIMRRGFAHLGSVFLITGVVLENLADFALSPSPVSETVPFAPIIVAGAGLLLGMRWASLIAVLYGIVMPVLVVSVPHARPFTSADRDLLVMSTVSVFAALFVAFAARRVYASLLEQAEAAGQRARRLVDRAPDGIVVMRHDGRIVEANRAAVALLGSPTVEPESPLGSRLVRHDGGAADAAFLRTATHHLLRARVVGTEQEVGITGAVLEGAGPDALYELIVRLVPVAPRRTPVRGTAEPAEESCRVLLVDDDQMVRTALSLQLGRAGFAVTTAADGEAALAELRARGRDVDLLLTDVVMPGMTGADLTRAARALHPALPIVLMSGDPRQFLRGLEVPGPPWVFIAKPFSVADLRAAVRRAGVGVQGERRPA
jgi:CheY-like chemotaxis protein/PAS domain-containing protein